MNYFWITILLLSLLTGCGGLVYHKVEPGDTLYSIGKKYGEDYRNIARWNNLEEPYILKKGQWIRLSPPTSGLFSDPSQAVSNKNAAPRVVAAETVSAAKSSSVTKLQYPKVKAAPVRPEPRLTPDPVDDSSKPRESKVVKTTGWRWPTKGKVTKYFSFENEKKGIEISGRVGQPILAAAAGRVLYSGNGLDKYYKNLIVIEHDNGFYSTYGHNRVRLVKEGDYVAGGEHVAEMGTSSSGGALLYFEIRKNGRPVNPLKYLSRK